MRRRMLIRAISFALLAIILSFAFNIRNIRKIKRYEQVISDNYFYAYSEIVSGLTKIDYALEKCAYSGDDAMIGALCGEVFCQVEGASHALSRLPVGELSLENTTQFVSRAGDFSYYILKKAARGEAITEEEKRSLRKLSEGAGDIVLELHRISNRLERDGIDIAEIDFTDERNEIVSDMKELEREFSEYPVLVYDGPFSDETDGKAEYLESLKEADEETLLRAAADFLGVGTEKIQRLDEWNDDGTELVSFTDGERYADVTRRGALVYRSVSTKPPEERKLSVKEGVDAAKKFLSEHGFEDISETYHTAYGSLLVINFAASEDGVVLYPDLVKISVSLEDGSVVNFDAAGYIKNHRKRELEDISGGEADARKKVSKELRILSYSPAVIPRDGKGEVLVHEFKCEDASGAHCIVYINPESLREERILILIEDENGTLAM